ncbi:hypothetical protein CXF61_04040 [Psychrobacter sp. 4Dc]|jgi:predicted DNA-binding transcriptional regulator AlpA|uniref:helix-turn-helix transcriptional regulator n=1 Tax=unclassified Psychrobacter TaxID=196806 RepID=UPI000CC8B2C2|nr:AlpA family phage regulatory protein [Psychrobacter sp. 4Dc]PKH65912.1 hypothetical protein CXF61_04040 [Psychrobacter sp. 4Dc]
MLPSQDTEHTHIENSDVVTNYLPHQGMSRAKDILPFLPFGRTTLHEWSQNGRFPASIKLSPTMVAWRNADVIEWLENHSNPVNNAQEIINE